jgi:hypothetical protein
LLFNQNGPRGAIEEMVRSKSDLLIDVATVADKILAGGGVGGFVVVSVKHLQAYW